MSNTKIILKKSSVTGKKPLLGDLVFGELALNYADGVVYYKTSTNEIKQLKGNDTFQQVNYESNNETIATTTVSKIVLNATTDPQVIDNLTTVSFESAEYTLQVTHPTLGKQISKLNVLYDDTEADSVEYGIVFTQVKLVDFSIFYVGSTIQVLADPQVGDCTVKFYKTSII